MSVDKKSELKIRAIENGTVIDHITANKSLHILKILGLPDSETKNVTVAMNVSSKEIGRSETTNQWKKIKLYCLIQLLELSNVPTQNA